MKKVLVMGGSYFIGKRISSYLADNNYEVYILNRGTKPIPDRRITLLNCDRNDAVQMVAVLRGHKFDYVVDVSGLNYFQSEILCSALDNEPEKFIFISSSAVYGVEILNIPYKESDFLGPNRYWGAYGTDKNDAENYYKAFFNKKNTSLIILRPPYVYGEDNYAQRESFIFDHIVNSQPIIIPDPDFRLQFIYTLDLARIVYCFLSSKEFGDYVYNVGNREAVTACEWIDMCAGVVGIDAIKIPYKYAEHNRKIRDFFPFNDYDNVLDVSEINKLFSDEIPFFCGLKNSFEWYLDIQSSIIFKEYVKNNEEAILKEIGILQ